jgi:hypothetical protein
MGHQPIGMEDYVAEGLRPLHRCLKDVARCDAVVGIVAWRYGYVPKEAGDPNTALPPDTALCETSITEFELRQAEHCGKAVLMFLLDPDAEWPANQFDAVSGEGEQGTAIARLRQELGQRYLVSYFHTPEELASLVSAAVYRVEMSQQLDLKSLPIDAEFNQPFIRSGHGEVQDTTLMTITNAVTGLQEIQALRIDIGRGREWWMTRLYFLSSLAADLTAIEVMVFVGEEQAFIGITHPRIVKERLAQSDAVIKEYEEALADSGPPTSDLTDEVQRRAALWNETMKAAGGEDNRPTFVTRRALARWLGPAPYFITHAIDWGPGDSVALQMQRLLDWPMRFVPVLEGGRFARIADQQALTELVAQRYVREQVSRALSTIR